MHHPYLLYVAGIFLLTLPAGFFYSNRFRGASIAELADRPRHRFSWLHPINAIDLLRSYGGMTLLLAAFTAVDPSALKQLVTGMVLAVAALIGLLLQHGFHKTGDDELAAPVAYSIGLVFAILPPQIALLAIPLGVVAALAMKNLGVGFVLTAISTAVLGKLFGLSFVTIGTASLMFFLPALLAGIFQRRLVLTIRRGQEIRYPQLREIPITASR